MADVKSYIPKFGGNDAVQTCSIRFQYPVPTAAALTRFLLCRIPSSVVALKSAAAATAAAVSIHSCSICGSQSAAGTVHCRPNWNDRYKSGAWDPGAMSLWGRQGENMRLVTTLWNRMEKWIISSRLSLPRHMTVGIQFHAPAVFSPGKEHSGVLARIIRGPQGGMDDMGYKNNSFPWQESNPDLWVVQPPLNSPGCLSGQAPCRWQPTVLTWSVSSQWGHKLCTAESGCKESIQKYACSSCYFLRQRADPLEALSRNSSIQKEKSSAG
jgi:hypothetical protein